MPKHVKNFKWKEVILLSKEKIIDNKLPRDLQGLVKVEAICAASAASLPLPASQKIY